MNCHQQKVQKEQEKDKVEEKLQDKGRQQEKGAMVKNQDQVHIYIQVLKVDKNLL